MQQDQRQGREMNWEPAHADHSIDNVQVLFSFSEPIDPDSFDEVIIPLRQATSKHNLTNRIEAQEPTPPAIPEKGIAIKIGGPTTRRVIFRRMAENDVVSEFSLGVRSLKLMTSRYQRWAPFFTVLSDVCHAIDQAWSISSNVKSIRVQYIDRFVSQPGGADHFEVLSKACPSIALPTTDAMAAFHVHTGWFDYDSLPKGRILTNINIDANDIRFSTQPAVRRELLILTLRQIESATNALNDPLNLTDHLHKELKTLFRQLISDEAATRIGLTV
ncbi:TIGR04255 family protein [Rhodopseudomonas sp. BR0G17]|uniref:TIGR04255 family protein n=1 Tax=Rhodopseudomonas sp. BR0G17 TaxID=2269368 RepID=UPI0013DF8979|nr:TIGR04255 family protein [Rhodopseudomonas sp. BR0G17]NEW95393.1 TIGR04255 family protein [Rhodopseudomonas sp. BR0G17]